MTDISIVPVVPEMDSLLLALHKESFGDKAWNFDQIRSSLMLHTTRGWAASIDNHLVGFILSQNVGQETEILTFCVQPANRRLHIAERLLQHSMMVLESEGIRTFFLEVAANNRAACTLYEKSGFTVSGVRKNYYRYGSTTIDAICYKK
jgi:ribosomal-protein-alanine acetyltransferase